MNEKKRNCFYKKRLYVLIAAAGGLLILQWRIHSYAQTSVADDKDDLTVLPDYAKTAVRTRNGAPNSVSAPGAAILAHKSDATVQPRGATLANIRPIRHVFQYGPSRTGSTTQFNMVCMSLFLHIRAHNPELLNNTICTMAGSFTDDDAAYKFMLQQDSIPQAVKSHAAEPDPHRINNSTYVFATAKNNQDAEQMKTMLKEKGFVTGEIQDLETLKKRGIDYWLKRYAEFFSLSSQDLKLMSEYFKMWDKLRQCCGMQMSKSFRNDLLQPDEKNPRVKPHAFCELINPDSIETSFMNTDLFKLIDQYPLMRRMNRPSTVDGDLDGTYCSRYNTAVRTNGIPQQNKQLSGLNSIYQGIENHWSEELNNPFIGIQHMVNDEKCGGDQFVYYGSFNGFSNQLIEILSAMRIAYSTNRTLILPPVLPHRFSKASGKFEGRDYGAHSLEPPDFTKPVKTSLDDVTKVKTLSTREDFPSWGEILNLDDLTYRTGVKLIDLYDFVKTKGNDCVNEFWKQPSPPVPITALTNRSKSWVEFVDLFNKQYSTRTIAAIGDAFVLNAYNSVFFTSHEKLFRDYDEVAGQRLTDGVLSMALSTKVLKLLKAALTYLPDEYIAVHLRTGDTAEIQNCTDISLVSAFKTAIEGLNKANVKDGSTVYIASNNDRAKECFNEITRHRYNLVNLTDILEEDLSKAGSASVDELLGALSIDYTTKLMLLDLFLVSMGAEVFFSMMNFEINYSFYQQMMKRLHNERSDRLQQLKGL